MGSFLQNKNVHKNCIKEKQILKQTLFSIWFILEVTTINSIHPSSCFLYGIRSYLKELISKSCIYGLHRNFEFSTTKSLTKNNVLSLSGYFGAVFDLITSYEVYKNMNYDWKLETWKIASTMTSALRFLIKNSIKPSDFFFK